MKGKKSQIIVLAVVFPILFLMRWWMRYPKALMPPGAAALIDISLAWVVERTFDFKLRDVARNREAGSILMPGSAQESPCQ